MTTVGDAEKFVPVIDTTWDAVLGAVEDGETLVMTGAAVVPVPTLNENDGENVPLGSWTTIP